jgi:hypothetical protein
METALEAPAAKCKSAPAKPPVAPAATLSPWETKFLSALAAARQAREAELGRFGWATFWLAMAALVRAFCDRTVPMPGKYLPCESIITGLAKFLVEAVFEEAMDEGWDHYRRLAARDDRHGAGEQFLNLLDRAIAQLNSPPKRAESLTSLLRLKPPPCLEQLEVMTGLSPEKLHEEAQKLDITLTTGAVFGQRGGSKSKPAVPEMVKAVAEPLKGLAAQLDQIVAEIEAESE